MFLIRNAQPKDLGAVLGLARHLNSYNLPADRTILKKLLSQAGSSLFLFVAEDVRKKKIAGCSLIIARHGTPAMPHLSFQVGFERKRSLFLSREIDHATLKLRVDTTGFTEIGGLVVLPEYRGLPAKIGKQLSYARFAFMARHPEKFQPRVLVEYLPVLDPDKGNRLWELVGQRFTGLSYRQADRLSAVNKEFIISLFPKEKIYCSFLPDPVVRSLGMPGPGAKISLRMLEKIGFRFLNQIDPFDGGPHYGARFSNISVIRKTAALKYDKACVAGKNAGCAIVMAETREGVRAVATIYEKHDKAIRLPRESAQVLRLHGGERLSATPFGL